jgi:glycosyltransferase involved in cell wall biosynthesis
VKIGFVTPFLTRSGGGVFTSAQRLAQVLATENAVRVFGPNDPARADDLPTWNPILPEGFPVRGPGSFGYAPALGRAVKTASVEVVHAHGLWTYSSIAAHDSGRPYVVSPHGMLDPWALAHSRWKKKLAGAFFQNAVLRGAACLHALCPSEADSIRAFGLRNPICVIPNGIDVPAPGDEAPSYAGAIPPDGKVLFYLGRLHPKKGLPALLRAWPNADPSWHLVIAGWDQAGHEDELKSLARELRIDRVHFAGPQFGAAKAAAYHRADAFVLPSLSEGLPMVILEAWAHAKPVLMTSECNLPEGFAARAAIRITPDSQGITLGLRELAAMSPVERSEMGARGLQLTQQRFAWPTIARDFQSVYRWILQQGPQPECVSTDQASHI